jgi:hypothetical protein
VKFGVASLGGAEAVCHPGFHMVPGVLGTGQRVVDGVVFGVFGVVMVPAATIASPLNWLLLQSWRKDGRSLRDEMLLPARAAAGAVTGKDYINKVEACTKDGCGRSRTGVGCTRVGDKVQHSFGP